jgi:hypothetical protein
MATFYIKVNSGLACKNAGQYCAAYITGTGVHGNKHEVEKVIDKNLPVWAKDGADFFKRADELERANGRSYRGLVIAIPSEAKDKMAWVQTFVDDLLKDKHAYRLAYHFDPAKNNPHAHLMFCERGRMFEDRADDPKAYFTRKNGKDANLKRFDWLTDAKALYLAHIRKVAPDYTPAMTGEVKIGPEHKNGSKEYKEQRQLAIHANALIRRYGADQAIHLGERVLDNIDAEIAKIQSTLSGRARVMPTPSPSFVEKTPQKPAKQASLVKQKIRTKIETDSVRLAEQISEDAQHAIQIGVNAMAIELETARQKAATMAKYQTAYTFGEITTRIQPPTVPTMKPPARPKPIGR